MIEAVAAAAGRTVSRETFEALGRYVALLSDESCHQNLVSASTLKNVWDRHILDSAQLVRFEPEPAASWIDIGSGAGLPGIVVALLVDGPVTLLEPRRLRAEFLARTVDALGLGERVRVEQSKAEDARGHYDVITARAVAPLAKLLGITRHLSHKQTVWVLPKGRKAKSELAEARRSWQCDAHSEPSCTDSDSNILVLRRVGAKSAR